jgi:hypothetical protein
VLLIRSMLVHMWDLGFHNHEDSSHGLLGCDAVWPWSWRQFGPPTCWYPATVLHCVTT